MAVAALSACTTSRNTPVTRFYHSFTARYNTYFNGHQAFLEGVAAQQEGNKDNFTEMLPVFAVSNKSTASIGKGNFDTAIEKCEKAIKNHSIKRKPKINRARRRTPKQKRILAKREYNPFLKNAWLLMGQSQFHQGEFVEAASTFSYINRLYAAEPDVLAESRAWLAACYTELDWLYDAEDIFRNKLGRDSVPRSARHALDIAYADYYVRSKRYEEALPYLRRVAKNVKGAAEKARIHFLMGQINTELGNDAAAYKELSRVVRLSPPYEVQLNARVMQAESARSGQRAKKMLSRLKRMSKQSKNSPYLDRIYNAIGDIYIAGGDTAKAVEAYETGVSKGTRTGVEKGALLLNLASIYYAREDFTSARRCYSGAMGMISRDRPDYDSLQHLSKVIETLEPNTAAVHKEDSMRALAKLSPEEQNAVFDKAIELEKKRQREERRKAAAAGTANTGARRAQGAAGRNAGNAATDQQQSAAKQSSSHQDDDEKAWYFYNPQTVAAGKEGFRRQWGDRELADDWRRSDKAVSNAPAGGEEVETDDEQGGDSTRARRRRGAADSLATGDIAAADTTAAAAGKGGSKKKKDEQDEKLTREYYQKQLPVTDEQIAASDKKIMEGLHKAGVIEKDQLENLPLAERTLTRLYTEYPDYEKNSDVLYQLYLLESRMGNSVQAEAYKSAMQANYPDDKLTLMVSDPNYAYDAQHGKQMEDSLYAATYDAFRAGDMAAVRSGAALSAQRFPEGENRAKFMFFDALCALHDGDRESAVHELDSMAKTFPKDGVTPIAQSIIKGLREGRTPGTGGYDLASLWNRRTGGAAAMMDSLEAARQVLPDRDIPFTVIMAYPADSVDENQMLYDVAHYNFTNFAVRNFEISQDSGEGYGQVVVKGFKNFSEAHSYAQLIYADKPMQRHLAHSRIIVISDTNMTRLGVDFSIQEYQDYYDKHFAPLKLKPELQLDKQIDIYQSEDELPANATDDEKQDDNSDEEQPAEQEQDDDEEWYDIN